MIAHKKEFTGGLILHVAFWVVFALLLSPLYPGPGKKVNMLDYMDNMYNSISKNSANFIPATQKKADAVQGKTIDVKIKTSVNLTAERVTALMKHAGMKVEAGDKELKVSGDLSGLMNAILVDAEAMFKNDGKTVSEKYGSNEKQVMYDWYNLLKSMEKSLTKQEKFAESKILYQVRTKTVEPSYNFYGVQAQSIKDKAVLVISSLVGYVIYTMWFGFSILFMFEGWGLKLEH